MGPNGNSQEQQGEFSLRLRPLIGTLITMKFCAMPVSILKLTVVVWLDFYYDDHFIFVLNDHALWGSYEDHRSMLSQANGAYVYLGMTFKTKSWVSMQNLGLPVKSRFYLSIPFARDSLK